MNVLTKLCLAICAICLELGASQPSQAQVLIMSIPELAGLDDAARRFCQPSSDRSRDTPVSDEQLQHLREIAAQSNSPILRGIRPQYLEVLHEALRIGPNAASFSHRTLRTLVIIEAIQRQLVCVGEECRMNDDLEQLRGRRTLAELSDIWYSVRDTDMQRALVCMNYSRTLKDYTIGPAMASREDRQNRTQEGCAQRIFKNKETLLFSKGGKEISDSGLPLLDRIADDLRGCSTRTIVVAGHTDSDGSSKFNQKLSLSRASVVAEALQRRGIERDRMKIAAYGERQPVTSNRSAKSKAKNRRVEVIQQ